MLISISYCTFLTASIKIKISQLGCENYNLQDSIEIKEEMHHQVLSLNVYLGVQSHTDVFMRNDYIEKLESCY